MNPITLLAVLILRYRTAMYCPDVRLLNFVSGQDKQIYRFFVKYQHGAPLLAFKLDCALCGWAKVSEIEWIRRNHDGTTTYDVELRYE